MTSIGNNLFLFLHYPSRVGIIPLPRWTQSPAPRSESARPSAGNPAGEILPPPHPLAMEQAVADLRVSPHGILVDGLAVPHVNVPAFPVPGGDLECPSISAASIVAKVSRDRIMATYHQRYPTYGFDQHKGYGTAAHLRFIAEHGASPIHRKTFSPLRQMSLPVATPGR